MESKLFPLIYMTLFVSPSFKLFGLTLVIVGFGIASFTNNKPLSVTFFPSSYKTSIGLSPFGTSEFPLPFT